MCPGRPLPPGCAALFMNENTGSFDINSNFFFCSASCASDNNLLLGEASGFAANVSFQRRTLDGIKEATCYIPIT